MLILCKEPNISFLGMSLIITSTTDLFMALPGILLARGEVQKRAVMFLGREIGCRRIFQILVSYLLDTT